jgi:hypothetical protein
VTKQIDVIYTITLGSASNYHSVAYCLSLGHYLFFQTTIMHVPFFYKDYARPITKKEDKKGPTKWTKHKEKGRRPQKAHVVHGK